MNLKERIKKAFESYDPAMEDWETIKREQKLWMGFSIIGLILAVFGMNKDIRLSIVGLIVFIGSEFNLSMWSLAEVRKELNLLEKKLGLPTNPKELEAEGK